MAQSLHIGLQAPFTNLPFGICAIYFDLKVLGFASLRGFFWGEEGYEISMAPTFPVKHWLDEYVRNPRKRLGIEKVKRFEKVKGFWGQNFPGPNIFASTC